YAGKGMAGLIDLIRHRRWKPDNHVVFVHTGGAPGLFAYLELLGPDKRRLAFSADASGARDTLLFALPGFGHRYRCILGPTGRRVLVGGLSHASDVIGGGTRWLTDDRYMHLAGLASYLEADDGLGAE